MRRYTVAALRYIGIVAVGTRTTRSRRAEDGHRQRDQGATEARAQTHPTSTRTTPRPKRASRVNGANSLSIFKRRRSTRSAAIGGVSPGPGGPARANGGITPSTSAGGHGQVLRFLPHDLRRGFEGAGGGGGDAAGGAGYGGSKKSSASGRARRRQAGRGDAGRAHAGRDPAARRARCESAKARAAAPSR